MTGRDLLRFLQAGLWILAGWVFLLVFLDGQWTPIRKIRLTVVAVLILCAAVIGSARARRGNEKKKRRRTGAGKGGRRP